MVKDKCTITAGDFNTLLSVMDRRSQKTSKGILGLNNYINQTDLIDLYRKLHPITSEYYSSAHETFTIKDHSGIKSKSNKIPRKSPDIQKLNIFI